MLQFAYNKLSAINFYLQDNIHFMNNIPDNNYDLLIADPPYGIKESAHRNISRSKLVRTKNYRKTVWDNEIPTQEYFDNILRISKNQIIFGINYFVSKRQLSIGPGRLIWDKVNYKTDFSDCEVAYVSFHNSIRLFRYMWNGMQQGKSITEGHIMQGNKKKNEKRIHPTQKPVAIYLYILKKYAKEGYKICDPNLGSASLAIACYELNYDLDGIEDDSIHMQDAIKRFKWHTYQQKLKFKEL